MPEIRLSKLTKIYWPDRRAVHQLDLTVNAGERLVLVGPSGCGKSTTLRLIAGLDQPTHGTIHFDDQDVTHWSAARRHVGMVFQGENHFPHLNVRDNLVSGLRLRQTPTELRERRLSEATQALGLEPLLERWPQELSGGESQRVALGRLLAGGMPIGLLDEPLSQVDPAQRAELRDAIRTLHEQNQVTLIYVTHDQQEAMSLGQRVAVMHQGRILQAGTPREIYEQPVNWFVASFMGMPPMNPIAARVISGRLMIGEQATDLTADVGEGPLLLGIRPEHLRWNSEGPVQLRGTVQAMEYLGVEQVVHLASDWGPLAARGPVRGALQPGALLALHCNFEDFYLFEADGEKQSLGRLSHSSRGH